MNSKVSSKCSECGNIKEKVIKDSLSTNVFHEIVCNMDIGKGYADYYCFMCGRRTIHTLVDYTGAYYA